MRRGRRVEGRVRGAGGRFLAGLPKLPPKLDQKVRGEEDGRGRSGAKRTSMNAERMTCKYTRGQFLGKGGAFVVRAAAIDI